MAASARRRRLSALSTCLLLGANILAFNVILSSCPTARVDMTEDRLFSISGATERILESLDEEVTVIGYFSERTHPKLAPLVPEATDLLAEYAAVARGALRVEIVDPGRDTDIEEEALDRYGIESTPFRLASKYESGIVNAYFAIVVSFGDQYVRYGFDDLIDVEPLPDGEFDVRFRNLEYDLTRAIKKVVYSFRGSDELFSLVEEPVELTAIVSPGTLPELLSDVPEAIRRAAADLERAGGEKFDFEEIDPTGDVALQEETFREFGARPMALGMLGDERFYLYAVLRVGDRMEQIGLTGAEVNAATIRESVENSLKRHTKGFLKTVGVVSPSGGLPPDVYRRLRAQGQAVDQPPPEFEEIKRFLREEYTVREIALGGRGGVPNDVDVLLVIEPRGLSDQAIYALDQFLMRGGRVIVCSGRFDVTIDQALRARPARSSIHDWLGHFGVTVEPTLVLDDRNQPLPIPQLQQTPVGTIRTWTMLPYPYLVEVREEGFVEREVSGRVESLGIYWGSPVSLADELPPQVSGRVLIRSSEISWTSDDTASLDAAQYTVPETGLGPSTLAVALNGEFESYFSDRGVPESILEDLEEGDVPPLTIERSPETRLVVVGNSEFLSDFVARALARTEGGFFAQNLEFARNLIDWMTLDREMLEIRARGTARRPLDRPESKTAIEALNYVVPLVLIVVLGLLRRWRRQNRRPVVESAGGGR